MRCGGTPAEPPGPGPGLPGSGTRQRPFRLPRIPPPPQGVWGPGTEASAMSAYWGGPQEKVGWGSGR